MIRSLPNALFTAALLAGCSVNDGDVTAENAEPFGDIATDAVITASGTEPFWSATIENGTLAYSTPENIGGTTVAVRRFAGLNGLGFSGMLAGEPLDLAITPGRCSDGMSDRTYPYTATLRLGEGIMNGCAYTDAQSFTGPDKP